MPSFGAGFSAAPSFGGGFASAPQPMGMIRSFGAIGAPMMQPYQQLQAAPAPMPVPQQCKNFMSYS